MFPHQMNSASVLRARHGAAPGPEHQTLNSAKASGRNWQPVHPVGEGCIDLGCIGMTAGGNDERSGGISFGELRHPAGDSAADRRKVVRQEQVGPHHDNLAQHRRQPSHEAAGGGRNREMVNRGGVGCADR